MGQKMTFLMSNQVYKLMTKSPKFNEFVVKTDFGQKILQNQAKYIVQQMNLPFNQIQKLYANDPIKTITQEKVDKDFEMNKRSHSLCVDELEKEPRNKNHKQVAKDMSVYFHRGKQKTNEEEIIDFHKGSIVYEDPISKEDLENEDLLWKDITKYNSHISKEKVWELEQEIQDVEEYNPLPYQDPIKYNLKDPYKRDVTKDLQEAEKIENENEEKILMQRRKLEESLPFYNNYEQGQNNTWRNYHYTKKYQNNWYSGNAHSKDHYQKWYQKINDQDFINADKEQNTQISQDQAQQDINIQYQQSSHIEDIDVTKSIKHKGRNQSYYKNKNYDLNEDDYVNKSNITQQKKFKQKDKYLIKNYFSTSTYDIPTIFDKIINKQIKSEIIYEDDKVFAFKDVNPVAPIHFLVVPKNKNGLNGISDATENHKEILGELLYSVSKIAKQMKLNDGYRVVINSGQHGGQSVDHLHIHVMGGKQLYWPPGTISGKIKNK